jgi:hypothetical protein
MSRKEYDELDVLGIILSKCGIKYRLPLMLVSKQFRNALDLHTKEFDFSNFKISGSKLRHLVISNPNLSFSDLSHNFHLHPADLSCSVGKLKNLQKVFLNNMDRVDDGVVAEIAINNQNLQILSLDMCAISDGILVILGKLPVLNYLSLQQTSIYPSAFAFITTQLFRSLKFLNLSLLNSSLEDSSVIALSRCCRGLEVCCLSRIHSLGS